MGKKVVHLVPHTHWDREWYFTSAKSKIYLVNNMEEILNMMESHKDYVCYVLDGQTVVLEDYLSIKPENEGRIKKLVAEGRLKIGPWYTQTDEMVVGGESIVRNLLYGKLDCDKFGDRMMIGYLPDSFGQSAAMPKILNGFGIDKSLFWRGYSERLGITQTEFIWEADDGSKVTVQLLPINYSVGITIPEDKEKIKERFDKAFGILEKFSTTGHLLVPNGHDQMPIQQNIFKVMDLMREIYPDYEIKLSSYEEMYEHVDASKLKTIKGELLDGKYQRIHRSIFSSRADLKTLNTRIENKITNVLEPVASIASTLGFSYQAGTIEQIWRQMLKNHAHDSIGCCCTDEVNRQVLRRFDTAEDMADNLLEFYMRKILEGSKMDGDKLVIFNTLPYLRKDCFKVDIATPFDNFQVLDAQGNEIKFEIIESQKSLTRDESENSEKNYHNYKIAMVDEIPAMGYKIYTIEKSSSKASTAVFKTDNCIENDAYKIEINKNGSLNITDKANGEIYTDVLIFEDGADGGDSYDYSPIKNDFVLTSKNCRAKVNTTKGENFQDANVKLRFDVPKDLDSREAKKIDGFVDIDMTLSLKKESKTISLSINVDNQAKDHRLRVLVPQNLTAEKSVADIQFGKLERNVIDDALNVWEKEEWDERPDTIYPFLSFVHTSNEKGLGVLSNSVREFQIIEGKNPYDTIAITLYRSFGKQGRRDLLRRPGRASGTSQPTPDSQLLGKQTYELAMTSELKNICKIAKEYTTPAVFYSFDPAEDLKLNKTNVDVHGEYSLFEMENSAIILTAVKKAEASDELCIRLYNSSDAPQKLNLDTQLSAHAEAMLDESLKAKLKDVSSLEFAPFEIKTLLFE